MEDFLDDIGTEVEINPDEVEVVKKPKKTRLLRKDEKKALLDMLCNLASNSSDIVSAVINIVTKDVHIHVYKEREKLWSSLRSAQSLMLTLVKGLTELFIRVYKSCQTGKDKYCRFQLEWHKQCSLLLKDEVDQEGQKELSQIHQRWLGYCEGSGVAKEVYNPVLIAVFDCLMLKVAKHQKKQADGDHDSGEGPSLEDQEGVYYRFGGAALAAMLHLRYDQLWDTCAFLPPHYIPFIKNVDKCVLEYANESCLKQYGSRLEVTTENLRQNSDIETQFISLLKEIYLDYDQNRETVHAVFLEFTRKLCNTRIQEFLDVHRQIAAKKDDGKTTLSGQNLREKLLTYHTNQNS